MMLNIKRLLTQPNNNYEQPIQIDLAKWQALVDLIVDLFDVECGNIVNYHENHFYTVVTSQNSQNFMSPDANWSADKKSFCRAVIEKQEPLYITDACNNDNWSDIPDVKTKSVQSYLGFPISWPDQSPFGTICIVSSKPTHFSQTFLNVMAQFRDLINMELRLLKDYEKMKVLAIEDELTGLYNRRGLLTVGVQKLKEIQRIKADTAVIYLDLDNMKKLNDTYGHDIGDQSLRILAQLLRKAFRKSDIISRTGGDEFVILLQTGNRNYLDRCCLQIDEKFRKKMEKIATIPGLGISAGYKIFPYPNTVPLDLMLHETDQEMYKVKQARKYHSL